MFKSTDDTTIWRPDVLVAGAGPAGATVARELARAGLSILMVDRLANTHSKIGETLPGAAIRLLHGVGLGLIVTPSAQPAHLPVGGGLVAWNSNRMVASDALADPYGRGLRLDRTRFDADLRQTALDAGAVTCRAEIVSVRRSSCCGWTIVLDDNREVKPRWLVDATGRRALVTRQIGVNRQRDAPLVAFYGICQPQINADLDRTIIEARPDGWFYAGRLTSGRWALGYHTSAAEAARLCRSPTALAETLGQAEGLTHLFGQLTFEPGLTIRDARSARLDVPMGDGWIACGDAAISFDPIAGQGLFNALRTGIAAAGFVHAALNGHPRPDYGSEVAQVASTYSNRRRALYQAEQRWFERPFWRMQRAV